MKEPSLVVRIAGFLVRFAIMVAVIVMLTRLAAWAYVFGYGIFAQEPLAEEGAGRTVTVTVEEGDGAADVGRKLENKGLIRDALQFRVQERFSDYHGLLQPGVYELSTEMTAEEMLQRMCANPETAASGAEISLEGEPEAAEEEEGATVEGGTEAQEEETTDNMTGEETP